MDIQFLQVRRTAKMVTIGNMNGQTKDVWLIIHGYGQLAERFINKFTGLLNESTAIVVPEALQRFYLDGTGGKIGANWMTREEREFDIKDNHFYLDQVFESIHNKLSENCRIHVLGFSQGTATVCRWLAHCKLKPYSLTLWAGMWPTDVDTVVLNELLKNTLVTMVLGDQDQYANHEMMEKQRDLVHSWGVKAEVLSFNGKHTIDQIALQDLKNLILPRN
jgi:predicted esterase